LGFSGRSITLKMMSHGIHPRRSNTKSDFRYLHEKKHVRHKSIEKRTPTNKIFVTNCGFSQRPKA